MNMAIATQDIESFLTTTLTSKNDKQLFSYVQRRLEKNIFPLIVSKCLAYQKNNDDKKFIFSFTTIGDVEHPYVSNYTVYEDKIEGYRFYYDYISKKIEYKIIDRTIHDELIKKIYKMLSKISFCEMYSFDFDNGSKKPIIIFNYQTKDKNKILTTTIQPKSFFSKEENNENRLLALRAYILSLAGLDIVESDLSNISEFSLVSKLRDSSIFRYKDIDNAINLYLKGKYIYGLDKSIWNYIVLSDKELDKYLALWLFHIDMVFKSKHTQSDIYLLQECFAHYIKQLDCNQNMLHKFILYKYYLANGYQEKAQELLISLNKLKISERLLRP